MRYNSKWTVEFYSKKVYEEILAWSPGLVAKFLKIADLLENHGPFVLGMPRIKNLGEGLFELRLKDHQGNARALFCLLTEQHVVILHGFLKKMMKIPKQDMHLGLKRMREVKNESKTVVRSI